MELETYYRILRYLNDSTVPADCIESKLKLQTRHYFVQDGILYKNNPRDKTRSFRIIRTTEKEPILFSMHSDPLSGHFNTNSTYQRIAARYFWPQMGNDIKQYVRECETCQKR